jgi:nucleoid DNA-binding protein
MNKSDLAKALTEELVLPLRKSEEIVGTVFDTMAESLLSGDRIEIRASAPVRSGIMRDTRDGTPKAVR